MSGPSVSISAPKSKIIIAIDFGTTCSSLGYVHTSEPEGSMIIQRWPDSGQTTDWVPTTIKYDNQDRTSYRWGYQIEDEGDRHEWFKLGLNSEVPLYGLALRYPSRTALPPVVGAEAERLTTDYLRGLKKHGDQYVSEQLGDMFLRNRKPQYIVTVPAVWSEKAQAATRQCAQNAGMGNKNNIQIITEPEAAGIYALKNMKLGLKVDDTFVLCDAGGGTVDLISYTVAQLGNAPLIYESAPGSGGLCGSSFLNRIFDDYLRRYFDGYTAWDDGYHQDAMHRFEVWIKKEYNGELQRSFTVPARGLPSNPRLHISNGQVNITGQALQQIFEPVIAEILGLVKAQIRATQKKVTAILLAGGFGTSKYLKKRIEAEVGNIRVQSVYESQTAIVRGALIRGLAEMSPKLATVRIRARKARKHYGTLAYDIYNPQEHDVKRIERDGLRDGKRVRVMRWFVCKGQPVDDSKPASFEFYWDQKVSEGRPGIIDMAIYTCDDPTDKGAPLYADDRGVKKLVDLKADVRSIPSYKFNQEPNENREMYYKLDFEIEMTCLSGSLHFAIVYNNQRYETVTQEFV